MKTTTKIIVAAVLIGLVSAFTPVSTGEELAIGASIPKGDLKMKDVGGKEITLNTSKTAKGLLVIFSCNTCPYVKMSETRITEAQEFCSKNGIGIVIANSNEDQRDGDDSMEEMTKYAKALGFTAPYVLDVKSELADAFGATRTPQCFLFDGKGILVYKGAIDDNVKDAKAVTKPYLKDALAAVLKGEAPATKESKSIGCSIKRVGQ